MNPNSRIPAIIDQNGFGGEAFPLGESGAILFYLAEKHGAFLPESSADRYRCMQLLMFPMAGIGPMFGEYVYFSRCVKDQPHGLGRYANEVLRLYDVVERRLTESRYLAGDEYTIADMASFPPLRYVTVTGLDRSAYPNMNRWMDEIAARPAVARAIEKSGQFDLDNHEGVAAMTPDQWEGLPARQVFEGPHLKRDEHILNRIIGVPTLGWPVRWQVESLSCPQASARFRFAEQAL